MHIIASPIIPDDTLQEDAGTTDCPSIFVEQMNCLYLLSFLVGILQPVGANYPWPRDFRSVSSQVSWSRAARVIR
jgi:hypothetical protein